MILPIAAPLLASGGAAGVGGSALAAGAGGGFLAGLGGTLSSILPGVSSLLPSLTGEGSGDSGTSSTDLSSSQSTGDKKTVFNRGGGSILDLDEPGQLVLAGLVVLTVGAVSISFLKKR